MKSPFSRRVQTFDPPAEISPISGRPYGQPGPVEDERADAQRAAGQLALAGAEAPGSTLVRLLVEGGMDEREAAQAAHARSYR